ncbi:MAG: NADH-quinone oxidoreductase subunit C [Sandaracinaceae bacterium]|nr:NADH-quinone oxidoreductase subunit C [Sandaracinaceae bacterium]
MSKSAIARLKAQFGDKILSTSDFRGDDSCYVAPSDWAAVATFLRDDDQLKMNMFTDLTAVDYPEREPDEPRFELVLMVRSLEKNHRVMVKTKVADGATPATLVGVWAGANWAEREVFDMFGIRFKDHPDLRRILMYDEFEGYPLRKDYPIDRVQPIVEYRDSNEMTKQAPFGIEEGQPFARIDWEARLGADKPTQVSPAIAQQQGETRTLSDSAAALVMEAKLKAKREAAAAEQGAKE